jgi:hypothetical protein
VATEHLVGEGACLAHPVEAVLEGVPVGEVADVAAAAEGGSGAGEHDGPGVLVPRQLAKDLQKGEFQRVVEGVA